MRYEDLIKISTPDVVFSKFKKDNPNVKIQISTRKDKKYSIIHPITGKIVHFGSTLEDFTKHNDNKRRDRFLSRARKWQYMPKYTPAHLSYHYLW